MIQKRLVRTGKEALELFVLLNQPDRKPVRQEIPGVYIVRLPEVPEEEGQILAIITYLDFWQVEIYQEAQQLLELLNGDRYRSGHIPVEDYPVIERALRRLNYCLQHIGEYADKVNDAKLLRDRADNLVRAISKTLSTFATIHAKLRSEYEKIHLQEGA